MDFCFLYVHTHTLSDTSETVLNVSYMAQAYCFTQRGLSPTEDMAASSPTAPVPKHGKVGVKESETQKHREQDGKWKREEREREWEREGRWRGREGVTTARGAVSPFSVLPPPNHGTSPSVMTATPLYLVYKTGPAVLTHSVKWHLNSLNIPVIKYCNGRWGGG